MLSLRDTVRSLLGLMFLLIEENRYRRADKTFCRAEKKIDTDEDRKIALYDEVLYIRTCGLGHAYLTISEKSRRLVPLSVGEFHDPCLYAWYYWSAFYRESYRFHFQRLLRGKLTGGMSGFRRRGRVQRALGLLTA